MKKTQLVIMMAMVALASGCAMKTKILDAGAVSMTHQNLKAGETLQEKGPVAGQFCTDTFGDKGQIGLMDEAIKDAQKKGGVDFITNAIFYSNGQGCVTVEGTGHKVVASSAAPIAPVTESKAPESAIKPVKAPAKKK